MVSVPDFAVPYMKAASAGTGLSFALVSCQCNEESGFDANAVSPTGAQGPWQFEPGTWAGWGSGSPFSWHDSTIAYIRFMSYLLNLEHFNVRNALAAYNAGPGNIGAGLGYADTIISCAGGNVSIKGTTTSHTETLGPAPGGGGSGDDWSGTIHQTAGWFNFMGGIALGTANAIRRL